MQENYYEESSKCQNEKKERKKHVTILVFSVVSFFLAFISFFNIIYFLSFDENFLINLIILLIPLIIFLAIGILLFKYKDKFCVDYDYIFVSGSITISKVVNGTSRKKLYDFSTRNIEKIGKVESKQYKEYFNNVAVKKVYLTSNDVSSEGKDFYYIAMVSNAQKELLILECTKTFVINVLKYSKNTIRDNELV